MARHTAFISGFAFAATLATVAFVFALRAPASAAGCVPGTLIKGSFAAVYYCGEDGKRYVFPNDKVYFSWYDDFSGVRGVADGELAAILIGGNVTYRPGTRMVKIQSDPTVYAVASGGVLRPIATEAIAAALYGPSWNQQVDDIPDAFFVNYRLGTRVESAGGYSVQGELDGASDISVDKRLAQLPTPPPAPPPPEPPPAPPSCPATCAVGSACVNGACTEVAGTHSLLVRAASIDSADVCFLGDVCESGDCCSVAGATFEKNANLIAVRPRDTWLYPDRQELCGRAALGVQDRNRVSNELLDFANNVSLETGGRVNVVVHESRLSGEFSMSRRTGTCEWWFSPDDLRPRLETMIDPDTDAVLVTASRTFDFGEVSGPDTRTVSHTDAIRGAAYSVINKEADVNAGGGDNFSSLYRDALADQLDEAFSLGVSAPEGPIIGNHCRNGRRDLNESGVDCGGPSCNACP